MAIKTTFSYRPSDNRVEHEGRVIEVLKCVETRNHSDTLDYSDWRQTNVTKALVYIGRTIREWTGEVREAKLHERFQWIDCTNLFTDRGAGHTVPGIDADMTSDPAMREDFEAWTAYNQELARNAVLRQQAEAEASKKRKEEAERNRPVRGKKMVVVKGRKLPVGTEGTVAYVSDSGSVLLKDDDKWQDRKSNGTWISASNLKAR